MGKTTTYTCDHCGEPIEGGASDVIYISWLNEVQVLSIKTPEGEWRSGRWPIVSRKCLREWLSRWFDFPPPALYEPPPTPRVGMGSGE